MIRFHKFTVGYAWCSDFGNPEVKEDFECILKFSPLHNIPDLKVMLHSAEKLEIYSYVKKNS